MITSSPITGLTQVTSPHPLGFPCVGAAEICRIARPSSTRAAKFLKAIHYSVHAELSNLTSMLTTTSLKNNHQIKTTNIVSGPLETKHIHFFYRNIFAKSPNKKLPTLKINEQCAHFSLPYNGIHTNSMHTKSLPTFLWTKEKGDTAKPPQEKDTAKYC